MADRYIIPCYLIREETGSESDDVGNVIRKESRRKVLASKSVTRQSEFYQARTNGYKTLKTIKVRSIEYRGEDTVIFEGERLQVLRSEDYGDGAVTLILWKGVNDQHVIASQSDED